MLKDNERAWIAQISGIDATAARAMSETRAKGQALVDSALGGELESIRAAQTYTLEKAPDGVISTLRDKLGIAVKKSSLLPGSDPMKEIDTWHDLPGLKAMPPAKVKEVLESMQKIVAVQEKLKAMTDENGRHIYQPDPTIEVIEAAFSSAMQVAATMSDPADRKRAMEDAEAKYRAALKTREAQMPEYNARLAADLWQPLKRQNVIPENMIPDDYSEVAQTFGGAAELYQDRLVEYSKALNTPKKIMAVLNPVMTVGEHLLGSAAAFAQTGAAVQAATDGVGKIVQSQDAREIAEIGKKIELVKLCVSSVKGAAQKGLEQRDMFGAVDSLSAALGGVLSATVGADVSRLVCATIKAVSRSAKVAEALSEGKLDEALGAIGGAICAALTMDDSKEVQQAGVYVEAAFKSLGSVAKGVQDKDPRQALVAVMTVAKAVGETEGGKYVSALKDEKIAAIKADDSLSEEERTEQAAFLKAYGASKTADADKIETGVKSAAKLESIKAMMTVAVNKNAVKDAEAKAAEAEERALIDFATQPDSTMEELLEFGFTGESDEVMDMEKQLHSIERLIAIQKRNDAIFDMAKSIVTGGTGFIASLVPAAGIAAVATQLMFSMIEAVKHTRQLIIWTQNMADARKAQTVQMDAMMNRLGLEKQQNLQADIKVALQAIQLAGKILEVAGAGYGSAIGTALAAGAQGTQGLMEAAVVVKTEIEMARAWSVYKKALATPQDRHLARKALRDNPTLAKYAMAYGAVVDGNAVAKKALRRCGIDAKTLANEGTSARKVVEYLEAVYREDPVLLRAVPVPLEWYPGKVELTLASWSKFQLAATTKAKPKVAKADFSKITALMGAYQKALAQMPDILDDDLEPDVAVHDVVVIRLIATRASDLELALSKQSPMDENGKPHLEMAGYFDSLAAQAEIARRRAYAFMDELEAAQAAIVQAA
jgi:hypothetical protein